MGHKGAYDFSGGSTETRLAMSILHCSDDFNKPSNQTVINNQNTATLELALDGRELSADALFT